MNILEAILQGVIQGITEFLPISSSGHLTIFQHFFNINENNLIFDLALHLGTLISVVIVYYKIIIRMFIAFLKLPSFFLLNKYDDDIKTILNLIISLLPLLILFFKIPVIGVSLKDIAKSFLNPPNINIVSISLIFTSIFLIIGWFSSKINKNSIKNKINNITFLDSFFIGISQLISAIFPGLSRSGSTLSTALMMGVDRDSAIDFSFLMGVPTILAASILEIKNLKSSNINLNLNILFIGMLISSIFGIISIKIFKWFLKNDKTWFFAIYTFLLGIFLILFKKI